MKQTFNSDVLEIPEKIETSATKAIPTSPQASATAKPPVDSTTEDDDEEDEDDWEKMFDESGDCLDPKLLQELTESVGKCKIELPKMDYTVSRYNWLTSIIIKFNTLFHNSHRSFTLNNNCSTKRNFRTFWRCPISQWSSKLPTCSCFSPSTGAVASTSSGWTIPMPWLCSAVPALVSAYKCNRRLVR